jgi:hypothetical protein
MVKYECNNYDINPIIIILATASINPMILRVENVSLNKKNPKTGAQCKETFSNISEINVFPPFYLLR